MKFMKVLDITEFKALRRKNILIFLAEAVIFGLLSFGAMWMVDLTVQNFAPGLLEIRKHIFFFLCAATIGIAILMYRLMVSLALRRRGRLHHEQESQDKADHLLLISASEKLKGLLATITPNHILGLLGNNNQMVFSEDLSVVSALIEESKQHKQDEPVISGNREKLSAILGSIPKLTELFQAHLAETCGTTEAATIAIIGSLSAVRIEIERLITTMDATKAHIAVLHSDAKSKISETQLLLEGLDGYKKQLDSKIQIAIRTIIDQMNELRSFTAIIHDVTSMTNVLAINASIEATHAGKFGIGFAVVAAEVRKLSTQVESAAADIESRVKVVSDTVSKELTAITSLVHGDNEARWVADIAIALPRLSTDFKMSVDEMDNFVMNSHHAARLVLDSVIDVLGDAQFQDIIRQQIEQVRKGLGLMGEQIEKVGKDLDENQPQLLELSVLGDIFDELENSYTMSEQRQIHQELIGGRHAGQGARLPKIELF